MSEQNKSELRRFQRVHVNVAANVLVKSEPLPVTITNVSKGGIRLEGSDLLMEALLPEDLRPSKRQWFGLSVYIDDSKLCVDCRVVYTRRLAQKSYVFGCEFIGDSEDANKLVAQITAGRSS